MKRSFRSLLVAARALLLSAFVLTTFSSCQILGAAIQLAGKAVKAFANNTADSIPVRTHISIPIRPAESGAAVGTAAEPASVPKEGK